MSRRLGTMACLVAFAALFVSGGALADGPRSRVAIVRSASSDRLLREATTRLRAELGDAGFDVVEVERAPGDFRESVEEAQGGARSFATVEMNRAGAGANADIWISDHVTGKTVVRRLQVGAAPNAAAVLAIRAMELLRASLLEVTAPDAAATAPPPVPADVLKWVEPTLPEHTPARREPFQGTALGIAALGLHGLRGVGFAIGPSLRLSHGIVGRWFGRLSLAGPLIGPESADSAGSAAIRQEFASLDFGYATPARPIGAFGWIGVGAFDLHVTGSATAQFRSRSDGVVSFLSTAGAGGVARVGNRLAFTAEIMALSLIPQPVVVIAGRDAGKAGAPSLGVSLGVLVGL